MKTIHDQVTAAKEIKKILSKKWPGIKFSARSEVYSGGCSINVGWTLGPTEKEVDAITKRYQYGSFDGMTDSYNYDETLVLTKDNEVAELGGAKYVFANRSIPSAFREKVMQGICDLCGVQYNGDEYVELVGENCTFKGTFLRDVIWPTISKCDMTGKVFQGVGWASDYEPLETGSVRDAFYIITRPVTAEDKKDAEKLAACKAACKRLEKMKAKEAKAKFVSQVRDDLLKSDPKHNRVTCRILSLSYRKGSAYMTGVIKTLVKEGVLVSDYISTAGNRVYRIVR